MASGAGQLLATMLQAPACCPGGLGKVQGGYVGLEAGAGGGRGFHRAAQEGDSAAGCVTQPHPAQPAPLTVLPFPLCAGTPGNPFGRCQLSWEPWQCQPSCFPPGPTNQGFLPPLSAQPVLCSLCLHHHTQPDAHQPALSRAWAPWTVSPTMEGSGVPAQGPRQHPPVPSHLQHQGSLLFPSWQMLGCATQHPALQMPALTLAPPQAAQDYGLSACLAQVSGPQQSPLL